MPIDWIIWQWLDSGFPAGGFAHSNGLESAVQRGIVREERSLANYLADSLCQLQSGAAHFVTRACNGPAEFEAIDRECDLFLNNHVANRASRLQGRSMLASAASAFSLEAVLVLSQRVRRQESLGHLAPAFGFVAHALEMSPADATGAFLYASLRATLSAGVRLGIVGPMQAQQLQAELARRVGEAAPIGAEPAQISPLLDLLQGGHDRLYSRLFQS
jgi:urease accessory protein